MKLSNSCSFPSTLKIDQVLNVSEVFQTNKGLNFYLYYPLLINKIIILIYDKKNCNASICHYNLHGKTNYFVLVIKPTLNHTL